MQNVKLLLVFCVLALGLALGGCASKGRKPAAKPTGYASADAKNVHDFMARYPAVVMSGDVKAITRLYADSARIVPFIANVVRPIRAGEMSKRLPEIIADERKANLRIAWKEPMDIQVKGERASVQVVGILAWQEKGQQRQAAMNCFFGLVRDENLQWKIKEAHGEPVGSGFALTPQASPKKPLPPRDPKLKGPKAKPGKAQPRTPAKQPAEAQPVRPPADQPAGQPDQATGQQPPEEEPAGPPDAQDRDGSTGGLLQDDGRAPKPLF